jgi:leucyl/phenylalanyl-tRNA---protein transferase
MQLILTPELIVEAYRQGIFPMAYNAGSPFIHWICPDFRGQLSIEGLHIPKRLQKTLLRAPYRITANKAFNAVIQGCAESTPTRPETWINAPIMKVFLELHERGLAHSVECWKARELVGGIYGLEIGGAFFGESMFTKATDASKIALVHMVARCWKAGFKLFDTQFINDHLTQFGAYELSHFKYKRELDRALKVKTNFLLKGISEEKILEDYLDFRSKK